MKPIIGISSYFIPRTEKRPRGLDDQDLLLNTMDYHEAIRCAGGAPVAIPPIADSAMLDAIVDRLDGVIMAGGADVGPERYGDSYRMGIGRVVPERDDAEFMLFEKIISKRLPVFGICRGMQLINVYFGGTLYQDLPREYASVIEHSIKVGRKHTIAHKVKLEPGTIVSTAFSGTTIGVNSYHHQAVSRLASPLRAVGWSEDGLVEAFVHGGCPDLFAVQWHPEMMHACVPEQQKLFAILVERSMHVAQGRKTT